MCNIQHTQHKYANAGPLQNVQSVPLCVVQRHINKRDTKLHLKNHFFILKPIAPAETISLIR